MKKILPDSVTKNKFLAECIEKLILQIIKMSGGDKMAKDVKCKVDSCKYYSSGDICSAAAIEVTANTKSCGCSDQTNCKTFIAK